MKIEWLIVLKLFTLKQRGRSVKGQKDFLDLLSLLSIDFDIEKVNWILQKYSLKYALRFFNEILSENTKASELNLNKHKYKKLKDKISENLGC